MLHELASRLDYLHLLCGLGWLLFACWSVFGNWPAGQPQGNRWLQVATAALALDQWLRLLPATGAEPLLADTLTFLFALVPLMALLEFSRATLAGSWRWMPGRWIHFPLLACVVLVGLRRPSGATHVDLLILAVPAAVALSLVFFRASRAGNRCRPCLLMMAVALAAAVVTLPLTGMPLEAAAGAFGEAADPARIPAGFVALHAVLAWLAALALGLARARLPAPDAANPEKSFWSDPTARRLLIFWVGVLLVGGVATEYAGRHRDAELRGQLLRRTELVATAIGPAGLAGLTASTNDLASPEYLRFKTRLAKLRKANQDARFVYVLKLRDGKAVFYGDSEEDGLPESSAAGDIYDEASPELMAALTRGAETVEGPVQDRWGTWVSGFAPVREVGVGLLGVAGVDVDASEWNTLIARARLGVTLATLLVCLLVLSFAVQQHRAAVVARRLGASERRYREMFEHNPAIMMLLDPATGAVLDANPAASAFHRTPIAALRGRKVWELCQEPPAEVQARLRAIAAGTLSAFSTRRQFGPDDVREAEVFAGPVDTPEGRILHLIIQDVTERRRAEDQLRQREKILTGLAQSAQALLGNDDLDGAMHAALAALGKVVNADRAYLCENQPPAAPGQLRTTQRYEWARGRELSVEGLRVEGEELRDGPSPTPALQHSSTPALHPPPRPHSPTPPPPSHAGPDCWPPARPCMGLWRTFRSPSGPTSRPAAAAPCSSAPSTSANASGAGSALTTAIPRACGSRWRWTPCGPRAARWARPSSAPAPPRPCSSANASSWTPSSSRTSSSTPPPPPSSPWTPSNG
jgi:PAS domain S-box-containing protein